MEKVVCVFERATGDPVWRHFEVFTQTAESRPETELVVRFVPTVGNYDYLIDYVFNQKGEIAVRVGATGIDAVKGVASTRFHAATAEFLRRQPVARCRPEVQAGRGRRRTALTARASW
jgi:primary-amine oxidase